MFGSEEHQNLDTVIYKYTLPGAQDCSGDMDWNVFAQRGTAEHLKT